MDTRQKRKVKNLILERVKSGKKFDDILDKYNLKENYIPDVSFRGCLVKKNNTITSRNILQNKNESYFTEEEMIKGYIPPLLSELYGDEKDILNFYDNKRIE